MIPDPIRRLSDEELFATLAAAEDRYFPEARQKQKPPDGEWQVWLVLAGRGWGKTRIGAEWLLDQALTQKGHYAIAGPTYGDCRDVCVEGAQSGLLAVCQRRGVRLDRRSWNRSLGELVLPNGSKVKLLSADEPDRARGWNFSGAWCDELASWRYFDAFTQLRLALRVGDSPRMVVTTTPKPTKLLLELLDRPTTLTTRGSTYENAENLSPAALEEFRARYEGTRIGRQELDAELLTDVPGAMWARDQLDADRRTPDEMPPMERVLVSVDPAGTSNEQSDETGIIVAGKGTDGDGYLLDDRSGRYTPAGWGRKACKAYVDAQADAIAYERQMGFDMCAHTLDGAWQQLVAEGEASGPTPRLIGVNASRGKQLRAEPIAAQYEQHRWHHVGAFPELEDQLCTWVPGEKSPDRMDALVHAAVELMVGPLGRRGLIVRRADISTVIDGRLVPAAVSPVNPQGLRCRA